MRNRLRQAVGRQCHFGLNYERFAPTLDSGKGDAAKDEWLDGVARTQVSADYAVAFERWRAALTGVDVRVQACSALTRVCIGHGNPSGSEVGLSVHHTWGVPVIPGSALKGILAHHIAVYYGAAPSDDDEDQERARWRGVTWDGSRIVRGPGQLYRVLFGSPDVDYESSAQKGIVIFHDALYIPGSCERDEPFVRDVLTVHQKTYYDRRGSTQPNDYDDPNPVGFINVKPGACFLLALGGPDDWTALAMHLLLEALRERGVGSKTSLGYGRLQPCEQPVIASIESDRGRRELAPQRSAPSKLFLEFEAVLAGKHGSSVRDILTELLDQWPSRLRELDLDERRRAAVKIEKRGERTLKKSSCADLAARIHAWTSELRREDTNQD